MTSDAQFYHLNTVAVTNQPLYNNISSMSDTAQYKTKQHNMQPYTAAL